MVSMKDIAKECGVSVATVSKALNDYSDIGIKTREKVRKVADSLGYFPNSSARALKTKRTCNLGVLLTDQAGSGLTHDFFSHVLESFKVTAEEAGYDITFTCQNVSRKKTTYLEHCRYRGFDGVLIANIDFYDASVQELIMGDLPVVTVDHVFDNRIAVVSDNVGGMRDLVNYVVEMGHRKIAYIHGEDNSVTRARLGSFHHTLSLHGISVPEEYIIQTAYRNVEGAQEATGELLSLPDPPTCILYPDDLSCVGGINRLRSMGKVIGRDISIAGYDGMYLSRVLDPPICTIHQDTESIGRIAAERLISLIENPRTTIIERIQVAGELDRGRSIAQLC